MLVSTLIVSGAFLIAPSAPGLPVLPAPEVSVMNDPVSGTVGAVDWENKIFSIRTDGERTRTVSWNDDTAFVLDGEETTAQAVLTRDAEVDVEFGEQDGIAARVERKSE